jgi:hypothetical protein
LVALSLPRQAAFSALTSSSPVNRTETSAAPAFQQGGCVTLGHRGAHGRVGELRPVGATVPLFGAVGFDEDHDFVIPSRELSHLRGAALVWIPRIMTGPAHCVLPS